LNSFCCLIQGADIIRLWWRYLLNLLSAVSNELTHNLFALGLIDVCFFTFCMDKTQDHFDQVTTRKKPVVFLIAKKYMRCIHIPAGNLWVALWMTFQFHFMLLRWWFGAYTSVWSEFEKKPDAEDGKDAKSRYLAA
jgi:hypothetical protein